MEWLTGTLKIDFLTANNNYLLVDIYIHLILGVLLVEIIYLIKINLELSKIRTRIDQHELEKDNFLKELIDEYQEMLTSNRDKIETDSFIRAYFARRKSRLLKGASFIQRSGPIFVLLGFLDGFITLLIPLLGLDLSGLMGFKDLFGRFSPLFLALKAAFYSVLIGVACAIIINLLNRFWNTEENLTAIRAGLKDYLEKQVKPETSLENRQIKAINTLINTIENGFTKIEDLLEDAFIDSIGEIEEILREIHKLFKQSQELSEDLKLIKDIDFHNRKVHSVLKQIASVSSKNSLLEYPEKKKAEL